MCITWGVALYFPAFYHPHRVPIVVFGRILMAASAYLATNGVQEQLYKTLMFPSAKLSLFFKMFLFCNTGQMPVESVRLQLPILWQMAGTGGKAVALFLSEFTTGGCAGRCYGRAGIILLETTACRKRVCIGLMRSSRALVDSLRRAGDVGNSACGSCNGLCIRVDQGFCGTV